jgi:hypothetical protein
MSKYAVYQNAAPYFDLVRGALGDLVDGNHFFDIITDDIIYEVLYDIPGWPRMIKGRSDLMAAFRCYVDNIALRSANEVILHKTDASSSNTRFMGQSSRLARNTILGSVRSSKSKAGKSRIGGTIWILSRRGTP